MRKIIFTFFIILTLCNIVYAVPLKYNAAPSIYSYLSEDFQQNILPVLNPVSDIYFQKAYKKYKQINFNNEFILYQNTLNSDKSLQISQEYLLPTSSLSLMCFLVDKQQDYSLVELFFIESTGKISQVYSISGYVKNDSYKEYIPYSMPGWIYGTLALIYDDAEDDNNLVLKNAHIELDNQTLIELFEQGKIDATVIVECSSTIFRKSFKISRIPKDIIVPVMNLRDQVVISCFVYATEDFSYISDDFLEDYQGYTFNIEKYDILAIDDGFTTKIEYDESKDKKVSSIFSIIKDEFISNNVMKIEPTSKKIVIHLPEEQFGCYENMKNNDNYQEIFFSILTIPALIACLQSIQDQMLYGEVTLDNIHIDYSWFGSIEYAYKNQFNEDLDENKFKKLNVVELSQQLMNYASVTAISDLFKQEFSKLVRGDNDDE